jgi:hypothetical protein
MSPKYVVYSRHSEEGYDEYFKASLEFTASPNQEILEVK